MQELLSLLQQISYESVRGDANRRIADICCHSGRVQKDSLFVCIKGFRTDGHEYIGEALLAGAGAIVVDESYVIESRHGALILTEHMKVNLSQLTEKRNVCVIVVSDTRRALSGLSAAFYNDPAKRLHMIGITGTSGKTTTAFMTAAILREAGYKVGMIGTILWDNGDSRIEATHTTPESCEIQKLLSEMVEHGCDCCIMEVSSQGIALQRVRDIFFDIGIFLNIEPDHIGAGEHANFSEYLYCKSRLMRQCKVGIVNRDDPNTNRILAGHTCEVETFSIRHPADATAEEGKSKMSGGKLENCFTVRKGEKTIPVTMQLPGVFNRYNALAAILAAGHFHVSGEQIQKALQGISVPGRCQNVTPEEPYAFLVDYAHNELSLRNLLETLRGFEPHRLIVIFGCGGNRAAVRRFLMGETAGRLADIVILTSDNPRWENREQIILQIREGVEAGMGMKTIHNCYEEPDRKKAVKLAIELAEPGDILVLAGKGHEKMQEISGCYYPMEDAELIREAIEEKG